MTFSKVFCGNILVKFELSDFLALTVELDVVHNIFCLLFILFIVAVYLYWYRKDVTESVLLLQSSPCRKHGGDGEADHNRTCWWRGGESQIQVSIRHTLNVPV